MTPVKLLAIVGTGGARMDVIAGWLGTLPNFVQSNWGIDPLRRQSTGLTQNVLNLGYPTDLNGFLESHRYTLDPTAQLTFATKSHSIDPAVYPFIDNRALNICYVDISDADIITIVWEFVIKTYLRQLSNGWQIDTKLSPGCTNQQRIEAVDQEIKNYYGYLKTYTHKILDCEHVDLKYINLFRPGGSRYFCEKIPSLTLHLKS